ncbi:TcfC E-set like domain-containing protein [Vibrio nomapromontoriensis]|uniref:TcfC E-set like domain-containing protein n=1 Tax=Vibrio nomapromontoriensis TaxID=2910246 RepID=UPI003D1149E0
MEKQPLTKKTRSPLEAKSTEVEHSKSLVANVVDHPIERGIPPEFRTYGHGSWISSVLITNTGKEVPIFLTIRDGKLFIKQVATTKIANIDEELLQTINKEMELGINYSEANDVLIADGLASIKYQPSDMSIRLDINEREINYNETREDKLGVNTKYLEAGDDTQSGVVSYSAYANKTTSGMNSSINGGLLHSLGTSYIDARFSAGSAKPNPVKKAVVARQFEGRTTQVGYLGFASTGSKFSSFSAYESTSVEYYGASFESDTATIDNDTNSEETTSEVPITLYLSAPTTIEVWRDNELINTQEFNVGVTNLDTRPLPDGIYDVLLRFYEGGKLEREESHTIYKSPMMSEPLQYKVSIGFTRDSQSENSKPNAPWITGYYRKMLPRSFAVGVGGEVIDDTEKLFIQIDKSLPGLTIRNGLALSDTNQFKYKLGLNGLFYGFRVSGHVTTGHSETNESSERSKYDFYNGSVNINKKLFSGSQIALNYSESMYKGAIERKSIRNNFTRTDSFRGISNQKDASIRYSMPVRLNATSSMNWFTTWKLREESGTGIYRNDESINIGFTLNYTYDHGYSIHSSGNYDTNNGYNISARGERKFSEQESSLLRTVSLNAIDSKASRQGKLRTKYQNQYIQGNASIGLNQTKSTGESSTNATLNARGTTVYNSQAVAQSSVGSTSSGVIVDVLGLVEGDEIEVNSKVIKKNGRVFTPFPVHSSQKLLVGMTPNTKYTYNIDTFDKDFGVSYKGKVHYAKVDLQRAVEVMARIVDENEVPVENAIVENHIGKTATDKNGMFIMPVSVKNPNVKVFDSSGRTCLIPIYAMSNIKNEEIVLAGNLKCKLIETQNVITDKRQYG